MKRKAGVAARAEARIRQICCWGLGGEAVVPYVLEELHELVDSRSNSFMWSDSNGQISNVYQESGAWAEIGQLYVDEFYNRRELEVHPGFSAALASKRGIVRHRDMFLVDQRTLRRSDFYNSIMKPMECEYLLQLFLHDELRPLGTLQLQRRAKDGDYGQEDALLLARLQPFMNHALMPRAQVRTAPLVDSGESGLIIADRRGRPLGFSAQGRRLLYLATHAATPAGRNPPAPRELPPAVAAICEHLDAVYAGRPDAPVPVVEHVNVWGKFVFRAHWLETEGADAGLVGISLSREEPLPLRLMRGIRVLPLSSRQSEVAYLLAMGCTHADIAGRLGVTRNTAISHSRWVYEKLDAHNRESLKGKLLEAGLQPCVNG